MYVQGVIVFFKLGKPLIHFSVATHPVASAQMRRLPTTMQRREQTVGGISRDTSG